MTRSPGVRPRAGRLHRSAKPRRLAVLALSVLVAAALAGSPSAARAVEPGDPAVAAAFGFLYRQMDRFSRSVLVAGEPGYEDYYASGIMDSSAGGSLSVVSDGCDRPRSGRDCVHLRFVPAPGGTETWAGLYFQYPEGNWGTSPGRDLSGATRVSLWARSNPPMVVELTAGGINAGLRTGHPYRDSFGPIPVGNIGLDDRWRRFSIPLEGQDLRSVIGPLAVSVSTARGGRPGSVYLDDVEIDQPRQDEPRFLQSYLPGTCATGAPENVSHVYDQSLVLLALLARGTPEDLRRAALIAEALLQAQGGDRSFRGPRADGRLRNAYASGRLLDSATGTARLPGRWDPAQSRYLEDEYAAGSDTGNSAWAALALVQAHRLLPDPERPAYLEAALRLGDWIVRENRAGDRLGGFRGGFEGFEGNGDAGGQVRSQWRSTEHNIDLVALFGHLARAVGEDSAEGRRWMAEQAHARHFVERMVEQSDDGVYLRTGAGSGSGGTATGSGVIPLDAQTWSVLGLWQPERYQPALDWALRHCRAHEVANAFDFNCRDGDGAWWEGTAQAAAALQRLGRGGEAAPIIGALREAQLREGPAAGALPAASRCGLSTGFDHLWHADGQVKPWVYPDTPHIGATAWYLFALLGRNPFDLPGRTGR